jgi:hypothetical protein
LVKVMAPEKLNKQQAEKQFDACKQQDNESLVNYVGRLQRQGRLFVAYNPGKAKKLDKLLKAKLVAGLANEVATPMVNSLMQNEEYKAMAFSTLVERLSTILGKLSVSSRYEKLQEANEAENSRKQRASESLSAATGYPERKKEDKTKTVSSAQVEAAIATQVAVTTAINRHQANNGMSSGDPGQADARRGGPARQDYQVLVPPATGGDPWPNAYCGYCNYYGHDYATCPTELLQRLGQQQDLGVTMGGRQGGRNQKGWTGGYRGNNFGGNRGNRGRNYTNEKGPQTERPQQGATKGPQFVPPKPTGQQNTQAQGGQQQRGRAQAVDGEDVFEARPANQ